jgi:hypothetical protein
MPAKVQVHDFGSISEAAAEAGQIRTKIIPLATDGAGACAATAVHVGPTGYYPVVRLKRVICDTADPATTLTFTVTAGTLVGPASIVIALVASTVNTQMLDQLLYDLTDASQINVEVTGGPASKTIYLEVEYWSET